METKNSFHITKKNQQGGVSGSEVMRSGYIWLAALLCFIWYVAGTFQMYTAAVALFIGAAFFITLYLCAIHAGKGFRMLIRILYFVSPFFILSVENIKKAMLTFARKVADYLADYGQSKELFHRILQNKAVDMQTGNVDFLPFVVGALGITLWLVLLIALLWKIHPCLLFFVVAICFCIPFFVWGVRPELFSVLSFLIFCFFFFAPSFWGGALGTVILVALLAGGSILGLTNTDKMSTAQKNWNKERYQENASVLPEGKFSKAKKVKRSDKVALEVTLHKKNSYYLRGFVGTTYENNAWETSNEDWNVFGTDSSMLAASGQEAYSSLLWLHNKDFYGNTAMYHFVRQKKLADGKADPSLYILSVKNVGANRKYLYLPYECAVSPSDYENDGTAAINKTENLFASGIHGAGEYSFKTMETMAGKLKSATTITGGNSNVSSQKMTESYKEYVNSTCLFLNKETKTLISSATEGTLQDNLSVLAIINRVKNFMKSSITYTENPGTIPKGEDFAKWFFEDKKSGYDVQYAAAAVMMFRYYGIPSRYVEGYLLTPENVNNAGTSEQVNVSQKYAHAWPEIYLDGMGWIPVEVTPKYENVMGIPYYQTQETAVSNSDPTDKSLKGKDKNEEEDAQEKQKQSTQKQEQTENQKIKKKEQTTEKQNVQTPEQRQKNTSQGDGNKQGRANTVRKVTGLLLILLFILLILLFAFRKRLKKVYWNYKTDKLLKEQKYSQAVMLWYDILCKQVYGKEKIKDNRMRTFEKRLRMIDNEIDHKKLHLCMTIRQKAVYAPEQISRKEAKAAIHFLKNEVEKLQ